MRHVGYVILFVADLERSVAFYRDVVGLEVRLVGDVDGEAERLRAAGATILKGPVDRPWGHRTLHLEDPDGFVVELAAEIPRQPPEARR